LKIALQQTPFNDESVVGEFKLQFMVSRACNYNQVYHVKSFSSRVTAPCQAILTIFSTIQVVDFAASLD
jgi:predicted membrane-bound mannosyltransferase